MREIDPNGVLLSGQRSQRASSRARMVRYLPSSKKTREITWTDGARVMDEPEVIRNALQYLGLISLQRQRSAASAVECQSVTVEQDLDTEEVGGLSPFGPTIFQPRQCSARLNPDVLIVDDTPEGSNEIGF